MQPLTCREKLTPFRNFFPGAVHKTCAGQKKSNAGNSMFAEASTAAVASFVPQAVCAYSQREVNSQFIPAHERS